MKILFIHPNFPGQFKHIARHFGKDVNHEVLFICTYSNNVSIPGVKKILSKSTSDKNYSNVHKYLTSLEKAIYTGEEIWQVCKKLKQSGFTPDVIYAHPAWGSGIFLKDIYPQIPYIAYMEFYYHPFGADVHFYPGYNNSPVIKDDKIDYKKVARLRIKNANNLINLESCDWAITPTNWQATLYPSDFHHKFSVIHEGIDTDILHPSKPSHPVSLPNGKMLDGDAEIVTYSARNFEPYRGFDQVMRAIEILMKKRPKAHFLMVGGDGVSYGVKLPDGKTYRQKMLEELDLDQSRIHWYGKLPYESYINILRYSMCHIYLTKPFVLSWSLLEAMSLGCAIVASNTAPVLEVITHEKEGLLTDFFDQNEIASKVSFILDNTDKGEIFRKNARQKILDNYSLKHILPKYEKLIFDIVNCNKNSEIFELLKPNL